MDVQVDAERGFVTIRLWGQQTRKGLERAFTSLASRPDYKPGMNRLWDMREATLTRLSAADLMSIGRFIRQQAATHGRRSAVLVDRDVDYGVTRMFELMNDGQLPVRLRGFRSRSEAEAWVSGGPETQPDPK